MSQLYNKIGPNNKEQILDKKINIMLISIILLLIFGFLYIVITIFQIKYLAFIFNIRLDTLEIIFMLLYFIFGLIMVKYGMYNPLNNKTTKDNSMFIWVNFLKLKISKCETWLDYLKLILIRNEVIYQLHKIEKNLEHLFIFGFNIENEKKLIREIIISLKKLLPISKSRDNDKNRKRAIEILEIISTGYENIFETSVINDNKDNLFKTKMKLNKNLYKKIDNIEGRMKISLDDFNLKKIVLVAFLLLLIISLLYLKYTGNELVDWVVYIFAIIPLFSFLTNIIKN